MLNFDISSFPTVKSTNDMLKELARYGQKEGKVIVSNAQTAGKGTRGRTFYSPSGGIYFSLLVRPDLPLAEIALLTPCMAVCALQAIEAATSKRAEIKWVNDIYLDGKKVCGILTESGRDINDQLFAVIGVGINLSAPISGFQDIKNAGALFDAPPSSEVKDKLIAHILARFALYYPGLTAKAYLPLYRNRAYQTGKDIVITENGATYKAKGLSIGDNFELIVSTPEGQRALNSADIEIIPDLQDS